MIAPGDHDGDSARGFLPGGIYSAQGWREWGRTYQFLGADLTVGGPLADGGCLCGFGETCELCLPLYGPGPPGRTMTVTTAPRDDDTRELPGLADRARALTELRLARLRVVRSWIINTILLEAAILLGWIAWREVLEPNLQRFLP